MVKSDISIIASSIRKHRGLRGLTQKQLADKVGVRFQHIYRWERGVKPTARYLAKLASALDVDVSELTAPPPVSDRREIIGAHTTTDIDIPEARQRRLLEETVVAALVKDPRLRLMDEHLEEIVRYLRSQGNEVGMGKNKISLLKSQLEQAIKSKQKVEKELEDERRKRIPNLEKYQKNKEYLDNFRKKHPDISISADTEEKFLLSAPDIPGGYTPEKVHEKLKWLLECKIFLLEMELLFSDEPELAEYLLKILKQPDGVNKLKSLFKIS